MTTAEPKTHFEIGYILMERRHIEWARKLHNDESILLHLGDPEHISEGQQESWFRALCESRTSKRYIVKAISSPHEWDIGVFRVDAIDHKNRSVMVGLDLEAKWRGRGLAAPVYHQFLRYYFDQCGMNRIYLKVLESNERALHVYKKIGFIEEGRERQAVFRDGKFQDYICMSILREDYARDRDRVVK